MYSQNVATLAQYLLQLGGSEKLGQQLIRYACFGRPSFTLVEGRSWGEDSLTCTFFVQQDGEGYRCPWYEAALLRPLPLVVHNEAVDNLQNAMKAVDWRATLAGLPGGGENGEKMEEAIHAIVQQLLALQTTPQGKEISDFLQVKYWAGIPWLAQAFGLGALRGRFEVSQRFYLTEEGGISLQEGYRFLINRWLEKQWLLTRKQTPSLPPVQKGGGASPKSKIGTGGKEKKGGTGDRK